jgi:cytochrome P450
VLVGGLDTVVNFASFTMQLLAQPDVQARIAADRGQIRPPSTKRCAACRSSPRRAR